jgi:hypothetical protein
MCDLRFLMNLGRKLCNFANVCVVLRWYYSSHSNRSMNAAQFLHVHTLCNFDCDCLHHHAPKHPMCERHLVFDYKLSKFAYDLSRLDYSNRSMCELQNQDDYILYSFDCDYLYHLDSMLTMCEQHHKGRYDYRLYKLLYVYDVLYYDDPSHHMDRRCGSLFQRAGNYGNFGCGVLHRLKPMQ